MTIALTAAEAWRRAESHLRAGDLAAAAPALERALTIEPRAIGFRNLAVVRLQLREPNAALIACDAAITLSPLDPEAHGLRGDILFALERFDDAIGSYRNAVRLCPAFAQAWSNMCVALQRTHDPSGALQAAEKAFELAPERPAFAIQLGILLIRAQRYAEGRHALESALTHSTPTFEVAHSLFAACHMTGDPSAALSWLNVARQLNPNDSNTEYNRGIMLTELGRIDEALSAYHRSTVLDPSNPEPEWNASLLLLRTGRWTEAWPLFEARLRRATRKDYGPAINAIPRWCGEPTTGRKKILLLAEQGLGDTLMFCRYAPLVAECGFEVSILAQSSLRTILARAAGIDRVCGDDLDSSEFDFRIELMSLPGIFKTTSGSIPFSDQRYLSADYDRLNLWENKLAQLKKPRIGLMWRGRKNPWLTERSIKLAQLAQHLPKGPTYISLQKNLLPDEIPFAEQMALEFHGGHEVEFEDAAALIHLSDVVITIDTSIAHLAGGLGAQTLVLVPNNPDWRWGDSDNRSHWYGSTHLFRFQTENAWSTLAGTLNALIAGRGRNS